MAASSRKIHRVPFQKKLRFLENQPEPKQADNILIDDAFPKDKANALAKLESYNKHLFRPNTYLHKWWARRSGTTFRFILKQLQYNVALSDFYEPGGLEGKIIFDHMMGGGTTLHEAIRLGANVIGADIDPIPVLQVKSSLSLSPLPHKQSVYLRFFNNLRRKIGHLYSTSCPHCGRKAAIQFLLYGLKRRCRCRDVIFLDSLILREGTDHNINICPVCHDVFIGSNHQCEETKNVQLVVKDTKKCDTCQQPFTDRKNKIYRDRYTPIVVVGNCQEHGIFLKISLKLTKS
ncbi:MAG: hypothetical protein JRJ85_17720 [Deltaproteobacteria bacterium]|nr:hypothetical protein [Deltaproteobacteria bacterium]